MFLVSMADIIGRYERLPNDAVRAVAVAKRREYSNLQIRLSLFFLLCERNHTFLTSHRLP